MTMNDEIVDHETSDSMPSKCGKYELPAQLQDQLHSLPDVLQFIHRLQKCINKQRKKLKKLKTKKVKTRSASTQTEFPRPLQNGLQVCKSVTEEITEAAHQAMQHNGFVYEETSGLYYDYKSGYYYNAEYGLYYDGNNGTYLKYDQDSKTYKVHSRVDVVSKPAANGQAEYEKYLKRKHAQTRSKRQRKDESHERIGRKCTHHRSGKSDAELEDGECSMHTDTSSISGDENSVDMDYASRWPPCMRIIIEETSIPSIKIGSLHVITFEGGSIGREGEHAIVLPEINNSKQHVNITYDATKSSYVIVDVGSRNGTLLNGKRLAPTKAESEAVEVPHGSRLQIGSTIMMCHVHNGSQTCGHCEPGLIQGSNPPKPIEKSVKGAERKQQLKQLRKKFGLCQNHLGKVSVGDGYTDRAQERREKVGSQNPHEKTQVASLNESIANSNKGFKMLAKMGWQEGQALGKDNQGRLEPIELASNPGTSGMGSVSDLHVVQPLSLPSVGNQRKEKVWMKAQERYKQAQPSHEEIFDLNDV